MVSYYNEIDPYAAQWLRNLIANKLIADGDVDERSIRNVAPGDLKGYAQCHFFAGLGGWSYALRLAGWPDDQPVWTGSCPCQPFSVAGKGEGTSDERHLWPEFFRLIAACKPPVTMGEQVAAAVGKDWLDGVFADLEGIGYACGAAVVPACAVDAPHRRDRLWFVANATHVMQHGSRDAGASRRAELADRSPLGHAIGAGLEGQPRHGDDGHGPGRLDAVAAGSIAEASGGSDVADAKGNGWREAGGQPDTHDNAPLQGRPSQSGGSGTAWRNAGWIIGHDGKARRVEPGIRLLAHGVPARVGRLRAYGNAIVPQAAAEVIGAYLDARP